MMEVLACHPLGKKKSPLNQTQVLFLTSVPRYHQSQHAAVILAANCQGKPPHLLFARRSHQKYEAAPRPLI